MGRLIYEVTLFWHTRSPREGWQVGGGMNTTSEHETRPTHPHYRADRPRHRSQRRGKEGHGSPPMPGGSKESVSSALGTGLGRGIYIVCAK
jgi:hypothetical protein